MLRVASNAARAADVHQTSQLDPHHPPAASCECTGARCKKLQNLHRADARGRQQYPASRLALPQPPALRRIREGLRWPDLPTRPHTRPVSSTGRAVASPPGAPARAARPLRSKPQRLLWGRRSAHDRRLGSTDGVPLAAPGAAAPPRRAHKSEPPGRRALPRASV